MSWLPVLPTALIVAASFFSGLDEDLTRFLLAVQSTWPPVSPKRPSSAPYLLHQPLASAGSQGEPLLGERLVAASPYRSYY